MKIDALLKNLVKINSVSGKEGKIAEYILGILKQAGGEPTSHQGNIILKINGKSSTKALIFNGHIDTVPAGDINKWTTSPWKPKTKDGRLYGLGSSDMKGAVAVMIKLAEKFLKESPPVDLWFTFVIKEEVDGSGTKNSLNWLKEKGMLDSYKELAGIIGEPTNLKELELGHRGNIFIHVKVPGQSGHGSRPGDIKQHAVREAIKLVSRLDELKQEWGDTYKHEYLGLPSIGLTGIKAGDFKTPNKFPDECKLQFDLRTTPELHLNYQKEIEKLLSGTKAEYELASDPCSYGWCDSEEKIVKVVQNILPQVKLTVSKGASDQCFFTKNNIPAIIFGPGEKSMAHQIDEYCPVEQLDKAVEIYQQIVEGWSD